MQVKRNGSDVWEEAIHVVGFLINKEFIDRKDIRAERAVDDDLKHCGQCHSMNTGRIYCQYDDSTKTGVIGFCDRCQGEQQIDFVLE